MFHITIKIEFSFVCIILFFFLYKLSLQYSMINENNNLEYREKLRERIGYYANTITPKPIELINSSSKNFPIIPERVKNTTRLASNLNPETIINILNFSSMEHVNNVQFPSLCKEFPSSGTSIAQTIYCVLLIILWFLLLAIALIYQLRKLIKNKNDSNDLELGEVQREI